MPLPDPMKRIEELKKLSSVEPVMTEEKEMTEEEQLQSRVTEILLEYDYLEGNIPMNHPEYWSFVTKLRALRASK